MQVRNLFLVLLGVIAALLYIGFQRQSALQRDTALKSLPAAGSGVTVVHFYADW